MGVSEWLSLAAVVIAAIGAIMSYVALRRSDEAIDESRNAPRRQEQHDRRARLGSQVETLLELLTKISARLSAPLEGEPDDFRSHAAALERCVKGVREEVIIDDELNRLRDELQLVALSAPRSEDRLVTTLTGYVMVVRRCLDEDLARNQRDQAVLDNYRQVQALRSQLRSTAEVVQSIKDRLEAIDRAPAPKVRMWSTGQ